MRIDATDGSIHAAGHTETDLTILSVSTPFVSQGRGARHGRLTVRAAATPAKRAPVGSQEDPPLTDPARTSVNLHTDLPTRAQIDRLLQSRHPATVSVYLSTDPTSSGEAERIELGNLAREARRQLEAAGTDKTDIAAIDEAIAELDDDGELWRFQARSLAIFVTPTSLTTFRLPNHLVSLVEVSDRFHIKPLLRAVTFPQVGYVLALAQGSVRLVEVMHDLGPTEIAVPDLPRDIESAVGKSSIRDRSSSGRDEGAAGQRLRQYSRQIDQALRPFLSGAHVPLILATTEPLDSVFRSVSTYPHLAATTITGNPEATSDSDLVASARVVLDEIHAAELASVHELYARRTSEHRTAADVVDVARAATFGAVDTVLVDIDEVVPGIVDDGTGVVTFMEADDAVGYGVVDEIARRVWLTGGRVLAVRREDIPAGGSVAAILRYPV